MIFLWATSGKWGSKLIQWGRSSDCSHFAVCFDKLTDHHDVGCQLVGESRINSGVVLDWFWRFKQRNQIVHALEYLPPGTDNELYCAFSKKMGGRRYDKKAVLWLAFDSLLRKLRIRNPYSENKWGSREAVYCQEILTAFTDVFARDGLKLPISDVEMLDPHAAYELLGKTTHFRKISLDTRGETHG